MTPLNVQALRRRFTRSDMLERIGYNLRVGLIQSPELKDLHFNYFSVVNLNSGHGGCVHSTRRFNDVLP